MRRGKIFSSSCFQIDGCTDDVEGEVLNNLVPTFCETGVVGCTDDVEGEALNNSVTVLFETGVDGCTDDIDLLEDA